MASPLLSCKVKDLPAELLEGSLLQLLHHTIALRAINRELCASLRDPSVLHYCDRPHHSATHGPRVYPIECEDRNDMLHCAYCHADMPGCCITNDSIMIIDSRALCRSCVDAGKVSIKEKNGTGIKVLAWNDEVPSDWDFVGLRSARTRSVRNKRILCAKESELLDDTVYTDGEMSSDGEEDEDEDEDEDEEPASPSKRTREE
jgi:hypothetical protein